MSLLDGWERMHSVLFRPFVFASVVLGDNKGRIARVILVVLDMQGVLFDTSVILE